VKACDDANLCTKDSCNEKTGECVFHDITSILLAKVDKCTNAVCHPKKGVIKTPVVCSTNDKCKNSYCDPNLGCMTVPKTCQHSTKCGTTYSCNSNTGECEAKIPTCPIEGEKSCFTSRYVVGVGCIREAKCKSSNNCTIATCSEGVCHYNANLCNDGDACTEDFCRFDGKCVHTPKVCHCAQGYTSTCNKSTGKCDVSKKCQRDFQCDDNNAATTDICDKDLGCRNVIVPPPVTKICDDFDAIGIYFENFVVEKKVHHQKYY